MAGALRCLARATNLRTLDALATPCFANLQIQSRSFNVRISPKISDLDVKKLPDFEVSKDPKEWHYVECLIPHKTVPEPKKFDGPAPSGWVPPKESLEKNLPYFVPRTKNHMQPVYLSISYRGTRHITVIKRVQGDIWKMEQELKAYLESHLTKSAYKQIASRVNEMSCQIRFRGDHVARTKEWLTMKGL